MDANKNNICKPEFELDEAERVLASLSLTSIVMGEYMVIMKVLITYFYKRVWVWVG